MDDDSRRDFWSWSLDRYGREGVERAALTLQDEFDVNVNILLWCCWCAERFPPLPDIAIRKGMDLSQRWAEDVSGALRKARRALRSPPPGADPAAVEALRIKLKAAELDAERVEQAIYESLACSLFESAPPDDGPVGVAARARRNLAAYVAISGASRKRGFTTSLIETLVDRIFPDAEEAGDAPANK